MPTLRNTGSWREFICFIVLPEIAVSLCFGWIISYFLYDNYANLPWTALQRDNKKQIEAEPPTIFNLK